MTEEQTLSSTPTRKVRRRIVYEGTDEWMEKQLANSMADGTQLVRGKGGLTITVITIPSAWSFWRLLREIFRG